MKLFVILLLLRLVLLLINKMGTDMNRFRFLISYTLLELKKIIHALPQLLLGTMVLTFIIGTIAFCGVKLLYPDSAFDTMQIDIVLSENSPASISAIDLVRNMQSTKDMFVFQIVDKNSAYADLANGKAVAIMIVPDNMINQILDGTNSPIQIVFAKSSSLSTLLLQELTGAGAKILSSAQAGIYTITDLYVEAGLQEYLQESYDTINRTNLNYALARDRIFQIKSTSVTGTVSVITYYSASAVLLLLFLYGSVCSTFLTNEPKAFQQKIKALSIPSYFIILIQWLCTFLIYYGIYILLFLLMSVLSRTGFPIAASSHILLLSCSILIAFISSYTVMIYRITPTSATGILVLTISSLLFLFLSGAFIPTAFFPNSMTWISMHLPTTDAFHKTAMILSDVSSTQYNGTLLIYSIIFLWIAEIGRQFAFKHQ